MVIAGLVAVEPAAADTAPRRIVNGWLPYWSMPASLALVHRLREAGVPAVISGAGPTALAFVTDGDAERERVLSYLPEGWLVLPLDVRQNGATVLL